MNMVSKVLSFFNLLDNEGKLSITNLAVIIMTSKLVFLPTFTLAEVSAFVVVMLNYSHKRIENAKASKVSEEVSSEVQARISEIESKVSGLSLSQGLGRR